MDEFHPYPNSLISLIECSEACCLPLSAKIGLDGTGREECVTLACHLAGCHLYRLSVSHNCSYSDFRDDLKKVFHRAGIQRKHTVLLIKDSEILEVG